MSIFLTGSTGYIGAHVLANLLQESSEGVNLLVRAKDDQEACERLWRSLQLHMDLPHFREHLERVSFFRGDLVAERFGLDEADYGRLGRTTESIIHCAASLNRKSEKSCLNTNLRGTLHVIQLAQVARAYNGLRRFSHVSTVAVAGVRQDEVVEEDTAIDWSRSDYDPYARTKKFCEYMIRQLLPGVPRTIFRPSIVLGDSRRAETNQFDMVRAFASLAALPVLPFRPTDQIDIVPVDFVASAIAALHMKERAAHEIYHLSAGKDSETFEQLTSALAQAQGRSRPAFVPSMKKPFTKIVHWLARGKSSMGQVANLLKVFLPYLTWNTVFDNFRVVTELGRKPAPFSRYCYPLLKFSRENHFAYRYQQWPTEVEATRSVNA